MTQGSPPRLVRCGDTFELLVDDEPFLMLGAQVHNSSGSGAMLSTAWDQLRQLNANTLEVPIYWSELEPTEGHFDFEQVDAVLAGARSHGFRVVLLWFGTWKNGTMDYVPAWIKSDPKRFPRMLDSAGSPVRVLSPHEDANLEADRNALSALVAHLRDVDSEHTVIMLQIQNEPGSLFVARDHSEKAERLFSEPVPESLVEKLELSAGTWSEVFGREADEAFAAYAVATYVDDLARTARAIWPLPTLVNVWLKERKSWARPGEQYPSGGPTSNMLDLWKAAAPNVDVLAPDIYVRDWVGFRSVCESYTRPDNPLVVPETFSGIEGARYSFYALGDYDAVGYAPFGFNRRDGETDLLEQHTELAKNFAGFAQLAPTLLELRRIPSEGKRRVQAAVEEDLLSTVLLSFEGWDVLVQFGRVTQSYGGEFASGTRERTGRALVLQTGSNEFYVLGFDASVNFRSSTRDETSQFLRVEEGSFDNGAWRPSRPLNGDQVFFGLRFGRDGAIRRAELIAGAGGGKHP